MSDTNKSIVRRWFDEIYTKKRLELMDELHAAAYTWRGPSGVTVTSRDGMRELLGVYFSAFPDLHFTVEEQMSEGDQVVTRWSARGTHSGEFDGIAPTGSSIVFTGITISRLENGRLVEEWESFDELLLMRQIGAVPTAD